MLQRNGIDDPIDLVGTEVADDMPGSERFPCDVLRGVERVAQVALQLASCPTTVINVLNAKPMHALVRLREQGPDEYILGPHC